MNKLFAFVLSFIAMTSCNVKEKRDTGTASIKSIASPAQSPSGEPYLFTDEEGTTYLSWIEIHEGQSTLKYSTLTDDQWSEPVMIDSGSNWVVNWADYPMLATNGQEFIAH